MKQLLILSGKGGTGKTTIASAFIKLSNAEAYADCDVDAPNLHLIMNQTSEAKLTDFYGLPKAQINSDLCIDCGICKVSCRFDAISNVISYNVNSFACEGCGVCEAVCPAGAVTLVPAVAGELKLYNESMVFSTALLKMGSGTSGKLVTDVKKQMLAAAEDVDLAIIDGSPGIGCPVIASLSGVDMVLIVTEPSVSGISDMQRIIKTAKIFQTKIAICINKYDTNLENTRTIESLCQKEDLPFVGKIPYDEHAVKAINHSQSIVDIDCPASLAVTHVFNRTIDLLNDQQNSNDSKHFN